MKTLPSFLLGGILLSTSAVAVTGPQSYQIETFRPDLWTGVPFWLPGSFASWIDPRFNLSGATEDGLAALLRNGVDGSDPVAIEITDLSGFSFLDSDGLQFILANSLAPSATPEWTAWFGEFTATSASINSGVTVSVPTGEDIRRVDLPFPEDLTRVVDLFWEDPTTNDLVIARIDLVAENTQWVIRIEGFSFGTTETFNFGSGRIALVGPDEVPRRIVMIEPDGTLLWAQEVGGAGVQRVRASQFRIDGTLVLSLEEEPDPQSFSEAPATELFLNSDGTVRWQRQYETLAGEPVSVERDFFISDSNVAVASWVGNDDETFDAIATFSPVDGTVNSAATVQFQEEPESFVRLSTAFVDSANGVAVFTGFGSSGQYLLSTDLSGQVLDVRRIPGSQDDALFNTFADPAGGGLRTGLFVQTPGGVTVYENSTAFVPGDPNDCALLPALSEPPLTEPITFTSNPGVAVTVAPIPDPIRPVTLSMQFAPAATTPTLTTLPVTVSTDCFEFPVLSGPIPVSVRLLDPPPLPSVEISFPTEPGIEYVLRQTRDFVNFTFTESFIGDGELYQREITDFFYPEEGSRLFIEVSSPDSQR